jgi:hypothetical protein
MDQGRKEHMVAVDIGNRGGGGASTDSVEEGRSPVRRIGQMGAAEHRGGRQCTWGGGKLLGKKLGRELRRRS